MADPTAAGPSPFDPAERPERIGPWRVLDLIGEGGMGVVYLAEQKEPLRRRAALKVIKLGMDSQRVLARFEAERRALAMMEHSCIATVFDAGLADSGQPYFAMEYVKGIPITAYCDQNKLSLKQRIELFQMVCSGVQHAHLKGVMHRDIKPGNVLVTVQDGKPLPKIIDFGLAKATNHHLIEATLFTEQGQVLGTPEYMSPEQAGLGGLDVDTRTDVYSLGVLLYELLVGTLPFPRQQLLEQGYLGMQRVIREQEPEKPSTKITALGEGARQHAAARQLDTDDLRRKLRGDLDSIVLKALEKDRTRRYETALELAADLGRHLANEPVLASPPSLGYRVQKFARRYRGQLVAAMLLLTSLAAGLATTTWFWFEARTQAGRAGQEATNARAKEQFANEQATAAEQRRQEALREREAKEAALAATEGALRRETGLRLVAHATLQLAEDPGLAVALAVAGGERAPGREAELALRNALATCRELSTIHIFEPGAEHGTVLATTDLATVALAGFPRRDVATICLPNAPSRRSTFACTEEGAAGDTPHIALSDDGRFLAVAGVDAMRVHRTDTGAVVREVASAAESTTALAFTNEAATLLIGTRGGTLTMTAVDGVAAAAILIQPGDAIGLLRCATRAARALVRVGAHWEVFDLAGKQRLASFAGPKQAAPRLEIGAAIAPDGSRAVAWDGYSGAVVVWDSERGRQEVDDPSQRVLAPAASWAIDDGGHILAIGCFLGVVKVFDLDGLRLVKTLDIIDGDPTALAFARDGAVLAVGTANGTIRVLECATWRERVVLRGHTDEVQRLCFDAAGELASLGADGTRRRWSLGDPIGRRSLVPLELHRLLDVFSPLDGSVFELVKGTVARLAPVPPARVFRAMSSIQGTADPVFHIRWMSWNGAFSPDGGQLATTHLDVRTFGYRASLLEVPSLQGKWELDIQKPVFAADAEHLVGRTTEGLVVEGSAADSPTVPLMDSGDYFGPRFRTDGRQVIAVRHDRGPGAQPLPTARLWDAATGNIAGTFDTGGEPLLTAAIAADGACVAGGGLAGTVVLWDGKTGQRRAAMAGHRDMVYAIAFNPGDRQLASGGHDGTIRLWDIAEARAAGQITGDGSPVLAIAFTEDGKWILYGTVAGTVAAEPIDALAFVAARGLRSLTPAERATFAIGNQEERAAQDAAWRARAGLPEVQ